MPEIPDYNPQDHKPADSYDPIPAGWYLGTIIDSEVKETKEGGNHYLQIKLRVDEVQHPDVGARTVFDRLHLWHNTSEKAVEMAQRTMSSICKALGHTDVVTNSDVLHHRSLAFKVKIKPAKDGYEASNEIASYDAPARLDAAAKKPKASAAKSSSKAPWAR